MKLTSLWPVLMILLLGAAATTAAEPAADRIVLLQVEITESSATLAEVTVVNGHLKQPRHVETYPGMLRIEVFDGDSGRIHLGVADDPTREILEWVDESGELRSKVIEKDRATAFLRLPWQEAAGVVSISRVMETAGQGAAARAVVRHLGSFEADWTEVSDDE